LVDAVKALDKVADKVEPVIAGRRRKAD